MTKSTIEVDIRLNPDLEKYIEQRIKRYREIESDIQHGFFVAAMDRAEKVEKELDSLQKAVGALLEYRKRNTLNFQLEKLDDYLHALERLVKP